MSQGPNTVKFADVRADLKVGRAPATTAHKYLHRWYTKTLSMPRRLSIVESIAACTSKFSVEQQLVDIRLAGVPAKLWPRIQRAAEARLAALRGELYVEGA